MLVRFVEEHRRGLREYAPGDVLELPAAEALVLMQDGLVVPATDARFAYETRST